MFHFVVLILGLTLLKYSKSIDGRGIPLDLLVKNAKFYFT